MHGISSGLCVDLDFPASSHYLSTQFFVVSVDVITRRSDRLRRIVHFVVVVVT